MEAYKEAKRLLVIRTLGLAVIICGALLLTLLPLGLSILYSHDRK